MVKHALRGCPGAQCLPILCRHESMPTIFLMADGLCVLSVRQVSTQRSFRPVRDVSAHDLILETGDDEDVSKLNIVEALSFCSENLSKDFAPGLVLCA